MVKLLGRRVMLFASSLFFLAASAAEVKVPSSDKVAGPITFHRDIEPLVQKHCQACHRPGEAAPFSLLTYKDARPWAKAIKQAVSQRAMPPWFADSTHGNFSNDARLEDVEIALIRAWVDGGAQEGMITDAPTPLNFVDEWKIGPPDLVIELPMDFPVPAAGTVDYKWFATDMKLTEDMWIERLEVRPGNRSVVHHALIFSRAPGSTLRSGLLPGNVETKVTISLPDGPQNEKGLFAVGNLYPPGSEMIGDYVPNGDPFIAPADHGRLVRAGSDLLFQIHYTTNGKATTDRTKVGIIFAKRPPHFRVVNEALVNLSLKIPPGEANHEVQAIGEFRHDTEISGFCPHMHLRGKAMRYELLRAGAQVPEVLLDVPRYDFNWQLRYDPVTPIQVFKGDQLRVSAWYDNSPNNRYNPDPSREVRWGDQSWDEMLFAFFDYTVPADIDPELVTGLKPPPPQTQSTKR